MQNKNILIAFIFILVISMTQNTVASDGCSGDATQECDTTPTDNCDVTKNTTFANNVYVLPNGIDICSPGITLDCNTATLNGSGPIILNNKVNGITLNSVSNSTIKNCNVEGYYNGLSLKDSHNNILLKNKVKNSIHLNLADGTGIKLNQSTNNKILNNDLSKNNRGLTLEYSSNNSLEKNNQISNDIAILFLYSDYNKVWNNSIHDNSQGLNIHSSDKNIIQYNGIGSNIWGITLFYADGNIIQDNKVNKNKEFGINLDYSENNKFINNTIKENTYFGMKIGPSLTNNLSKNRISGSIYNFGVSGFSFEEFNQSIDKTNTVESKPIYYGINKQNQVFDGKFNSGYFACISCRNITIKNQHIKSNVQGLLLFDLQYSTIINNTLNNNQHGLELLNSHYNIIKNNNIVNNAEEGINIKNSNRNIIYLNNFINNVYAQARIINGTNKWYRKSVGNYWSDFDTPQEGCDDNNFNGRCDQKHNITMTDQDPFAVLMKGGWSCLTNDPSQIVDLTCN